MAVAADDFYTAPVNPRKPPKTPRPARHTSSSSSTSSSGSSGSSSGGSSSGGSGSGSSSTANRYRKASRNLQFQIRGLKDAIQNEFARSRKQNIGDIDLMLTQQFEILKDGARQRGDQFLQAASDTEQATADVQEGGFRNLVRERADSMTAILEQGAGETDAVRALLMNARNWHANAGEANRTYFDTMQSINQGITDLNVDTRSALANAHMTAEGQKELVWQGYYNQRADALTNLGNTYGKRIEYLDQAGSMSSSKGKSKGKSKALFEGGGVLPGTSTFRESGTKSGGAGGVKAATKGMKKAFAAASNELGKSYVQQDLPEWIDGYEGTPQQERRQENSNLAAAPTMEGVQRAQGATLRTWG